MRALVLSGGGSKGAFQIGALRRWMGEEGIDYDIIVGVSVGALNAAGLGMIPYGQPRTAIHQLTEFWLEKVTTRAVYKRWFPFGRLHSLWEKSVYDSAPLRKLVSDSIDETLVRACGRKICVGAVCLDDGEHRYVTQNNELFIEWILASASYPIFLEPIKIEGKLWSDGGIKCWTPLAEAIRMGATEIDVIATSDFMATRDWKITGRSAIPNQAIRVIDLMHDQVMLNDFLVVGLKNDVAKSNKDRISVRLVTPSTPLFVDSLTFDPVDIKKMIEQGYADAATPRLY